MKSYALTISTFLFFSLNSMNQQTLNKLGIIADELNAMAATLLECEPRPEDAEALSMILGELRFAEFPNDSKNTGYTLLHTAVELEDRIQPRMKQSLYKLINDLLKLGSNPNSTDPNGNTALHRALTHKSEPIIKMLLQADANPHIKNKNGKTPLLLLNNIIPEFLFELSPRKIYQMPDDVQFFAQTLSQLINNSLIRATRKADQSTQKHIAVLLRNGSFNAHDATGKTRLHYAALFDLDDLAYVLIQRGSKYSQKDLIGNTPLHYAAQAGSRNVVEMLTKIPNIDVTITNDNNQTALDITYEIINNPASLASQTVDAFAIKRILQPITINQELKKLSSDLQVLARNI